MTREQILEALMPHLEKDLRQRAITEDDGLENGLIDALLLAVEQRNSHAKWSGFESEIVKEDARVLRFIKGGIIRCPRCGDETFVGIEDADEAEGSFCSEECAYPDGAPKETY